MTIQRYPSPALLALLGPVLLGAACSGGGGGGSSIPGGTATPLTLDFALRRALRPDGGAAAGPVIDGAVADINGDGIQDAVLLDIGDATAEVLLGDGTGDYVDAFLLSLPGIPTAVSIVDVSGDGQPDLAIALLDGTGTATAPASIVVFEQLAGGGFGAAPDASADLPAQVLTILPIPGDGAGSDLLALVPEALSIHRLVSSGGVLQETETFDSSALGIGMPLTAVVLDAGGDGSLDLVVGENDRLVLYPGDGAGGFGEAEVLLAPVDVAILCCVDDADGDGMDDLSVAQLTSSEALLLLNSPSGLTNVMEIDLGAPATAVTFPDLDGDGLADLAAALLYEGSIEVRLADAPLSFGPGRRFEAGPTPRRIQVVDLDGNALPDLACANGIDLAFLLNEGGGVLRSAESTYGLDQPAFVDCADLDGDGITDSASIDLFQRSVVFHRGLGGGEMEFAGDVMLVASSEEHPSYLKLVDMDEDGDLDVLTSVAKSGEVVILRNKGTLPFGPPAPADRTPISAKPLGLDAGDLDLDGDLDVVVAASGSDLLEVLLMDDSGALVAQPPIPLGQRPIAVSLADLDGDQDLDLLVSVGEDLGAEAAILVLEGDNAGGFGLVDTVPATAIGAQIAIADLNDDGMLDAVVGQYGEFSDSILVLRNQGSLDFASSPLVVGPSPGCVAARDLDRDGLLDLCVPTGSGLFRILNGDGQFGFATPPELPLGGLSIPFGTTGSCVTDLDGDGLEDLALVSPSYSSLWVVRNLSTEEAAP